MDRCIHAAHSIFNTDVWCSLFAGLDITQNNLDRLLPFDLNTFDTV